MINNTFKAIVIDDEQLTRRGLIDYIQWDEFNIKIVGEASDGLEGLSLAERVQPDLMLCDVRMPKMDGIALARKVKELLPNCKIIFLSAYSDVEYLKSAIQLKAIDYVEKPVNLREFTELIRRTVLLCREEREKEHRRLNLMVKMEKTTPYLRHKLLLNLIGHEGGSANEIKVAAELAGVELFEQGRYACCVLDTSDKDMLGKLLNKSVEAFEAENIQALCGEVRQQLIFVCPLEGDTGLYMISSLCQSIIESGKSNFGVSTVIGIGNLCDSIYDVEKIYRQASEAAAYYFFKGIDNVILYSDISEQSKQKYTLNKGQLTKMEKYIMEQDFTASLIILESIVEGMKNGDIGSIDDIKQELFRIYLMVSKIYSELVIQPDSGVLLTRRFNTGDINSISDFIADTIRTVEKGIRLSKDNKSNFVIREVEAYVQKNYSNNVSIADIAKAVYLSPTYLCALFKKEKGETINDYITKVRIQNAMWLLKDQKLKLYEVAQKVGYDDSNYFAKVFKKITGHNPSEYRDTI